MYSKQIKPNQTDIQERLLYSRDVEVSAPRRHSARQAAGKDADLLKAQLRGEEESKLPPCLFKTEKQALAIPAGVRADNATSP